MPFCSSLSCVIVKLASPPHTTPPPPSKTRTQYSPSTITLHPLPPTKPQPELRRVLYPVFIHTYLRLVARSAAPLAAELLRAHSTPMTDASGRRSAARAHELTQLQGIALPQHLETHPFAKAALDRASRPLVRMCAYSFELLMHFLQSNKLWLPLAIVNEHVRFEVRLVWLCLVGAGA